MASEYNLALKATLDTSQVQQELQRLKQTYNVGSSGGGAFSKGPGSGSQMQKIDVQLNKLNSAITGLQRAIEQLARSQGRPFSPSGASPRGSGSSIPIIQQTGNDIRSWLASPEYKKFNLTMLGIVRDVLNDTERLFMQYRYGSIKSKNFAHNVMMGGGIPGIADTATYLMKIHDWYSEGAQESIQAQQAIFKNLMRQARFNKQMATMIGGLLLGGVGSYMSDFGLEKAGAVVSGIGEGISVGGGAALGATMLGASSAVAGPIGLVIGLGAAAFAVTKSFNELEEASKKAAEAQAKTAEAMHSNAIGQSLDMYGTKQKIRAETVEKTNNLSVAKQQAQYFKVELEKARANFFNLGDPAEYEKKIREDAEKKKNSTVTVRKSVSGGGTATGGYYSTIVEYQRQRTDKEKAEIDKAANKAIEANEKKFAAAKRELLAAEANAQIWQEVADKLKESKEAGEKIASERRQNEALARNSLARLSSDLKFLLKDQESLRTTQALVNDILREKNMSIIEKPMSAFTKFEAEVDAFTKMSAELEDLRVLRLALRSRAFEINRDMELNGRSKTSNELRDMARRRDDLLHRSDVLASRAEMVEHAISTIDVSSISLLLQRPDLSHVTSLAQYGFNMGERDNAIERMDNYYHTSISLLQQIKNLLQQIKDKIQEGIKTEAVYSF